MQGTAEHEAGTAAVAPTEACQDQRTRVPWEARGCPPGTASAEPPPPPGLGPESWGNPALGVEKQPQISSAWRTAPGVTPEGRGVPRVLAEEGGRERPGAPGSSPRGEGQAGPSQGHEPAPHDFPRRKG